MSFLLRCRNIYYIIFGCLVDEEEVNTTILSNKSKSSLDVDNVSMFLIQETINYITIPFVHIFNLCFGTGEFTTKMKISKVLSISKKEKCV